MTTVDFLRGVGRDDVSSVKNTLLVQLNFEVFSSALEPLANVRMRSGNDALDAIESPDACYDVKCQLPVVFGLKEENTIVRISGRN
jgi:hypothetical protein